MSVRKACRKWGFRLIAAAGVVAVVVGCTLLFRTDVVVPQDYDHTVAVQLDTMQTLPSYRRAIEDYTFPLYTGADIVIPAQDASGEAQRLFGSDTPAVSLLQGGETVFTFSVPQDAQYCVLVEYYDDGNSAVQTQAQVRLDGEFPFYEMQTQVFAGRWEYDGEKKLDRYGNETVPPSYRKKEWAAAYLCDASAFTTEPFRLQLTAGEHSLTVYCEQGALAIRSLTLTSMPAADDGMATGEPSGQAITVIQGEDIAYKNDSTVRPAGQYNTALTPYSSRHIVMNMLDGNSFRQGGQSVSYTFTVEQDGYYFLSLRYCQSVLVDFPVFRTIQIDGKVPTPDFEAVAFPYTRTYQNLTVSDADGDPIGIYLEAGQEHTLTLTITLEPLAAIMDRVQQVRDEVNALSLQVTKITGNNASKYRDFELLTYIPDLRDKLLSWADRLDAIYEELHAFNPKVRQIGAFSALQVCRKQLVSLAKYPNKLPMRLEELYQGQSSVSQYLADVLEGMTNSPSALDALYLYQDADSLPKEMGFFQKIGAGIARFFYSFVVKDYEAVRANDSVQEDAGESPALQVWVSRARLYAEVLQKLTDETFSADTTGYSVDVSLMPDTQKLVLANAAGSSPDLALGINSSLPFDLGIRGALKNLREYEDCDEVTQRFFQGLLTVGEIQDNLYCLPETTNFYVLFYRKDILENFNLTVPDTMEDVKAMLPQLRSRGLNFFSHISGAIGYKPFSTTVPLLYQNGGSLYGDTALDIQLDSDATLDAIREMTELFTVYGLDYEVSNFYQHFRNGTLPIGVSDFGIYNLLINSAPEIANSWGIALVPGYRDADGTVQRWMTGAAETAVIFDSTVYPEQAWEFLKWWTSTETQTTYANTLQISYGQEYMWPTANQEAFALLPWKEEDKQVILEQQKWLFEIPRVPGNYMLERELSTMFLHIVLEGENVRDAVDTAYRNTTNEVTRKLQEFGYLEGDSWKSVYSLPQSPR